MLLKIKESLDIMDMVPQAQLDSYRARYIKSLRKGNKNAIKSFG